MGSGPRSERSRLLRQLVDLAVVPERDEPASHPEPQDDPADQRGNCPTTSTGVKLPDDFSITATALQYLD